MLTVMLVRIMPQVECVLSKEAYSLSQIQIMTSYKTGAAMSVAFCFHVVCCNMLHMPCRCLVGAFMSDSGQI